MLYVYMNLTFWLYQDKMFSRWLGSCLNYKHHATNNFCNKVETGVQCRGISFQSLDQITDSLSHLDNSTVTVLSTTVSLRQQAYSRETHNLNADSNLTNCLSLEGTDTKNKRQDYTTLKSDPLNTSKHLHKMLYISKSHIPSNVIMLGFSRCKTKQFQVFCNCPVHHAISHLHAVLSFWILSPPWWKWTSCWLDRWDTSCSEWHVHPCGWHLLVLLPSGKVKKKKGRRNTEYFKQSPDTVD